MDELLRQWREAYDEMRKAEQPYLDQINEIELLMDEARLPYAEELERLEFRIDEDARASAQSHKAHGVGVTYKKGYTRTSFPVDAVKMVLAFLKDFAPNAAEALQEAQKDTFVKPSVSIKAVK